MEHSCKPTINKQRIRKDGIIANSLELQINNPSDNVVLVTSDINLQNKAQMANLTVFDTDELEEEN